MRSKHGDLTPREAAIVILCGWAEAAIHGKTMDIEEMDDRESYRQQLRSALVKEVNRLRARIDIS